MVARFFKGYASLEVTWQREVATDLTFLTGLLWLSTLKNIVLIGETVFNFVTISTVFFNVESQSKKV
jgi:hypothetical protein